MMTQLSASPATSTPCQKLDVASRTAFGVARKSRSSADRGAAPWTRIGHGTRPSSYACTSRIAAYDVNRTNARPLRAVEQRPITSAPPRG